MKKKILYSLASLFLIVVMFFNVQFNDEKNDFSNFNLDALMISQETVNANENDPLICWSVLQDCWLYGCAYRASCGLASPRETCQQHFSDNPEDEGICGGN